MKAPSQPEFVERADAKATLVDAAAGLRTLSIVSNLGPGHAELCRSNGPTAPEAFRQAGLRWRGGLEPMRTRRQ